MASDYWHITEVVLKGLGYVAPAATPVVYLRAAWEADFRPRWFNGWWVPAFVILALICCDYMYAVCLLPSWLIPVSLSSYFCRWLQPIVADLPFNHALLGWAAHRLSASYLSIPILLASATVKLFIVIPLLLIQHGSPDRGTEQPAFVNYFFGKGIKDIRTMGVRSFALLLMSAWAILVGMGYLAAQLGCFGIWLGFAVGIPAAVALIFPTVLILIILVLLMVTHSLTMGCIIAVGYGFALASQLAERSVLFVRSRYVKCPHSGCHEPLPLPTFACPDCGVQHDRLLPGRYGIFRRRCRCGTKLPTLFILGKGKLAASCPHCHKPISETLFTANIHLPIYAGPSAGKTMFMMAATHQIVERKQLGLSAGFVESADAQSYRHRWKPDFETGIFREKTHQLLPDAFLLSLQVPGGLPVSLYMYDPAGEALLEQSALEAQRFLRYIDGIVLMLDPFALPSLAKAYRASGKKLPQTTSEANPQDVLAQIRGALSNHANLSAIQQMNCPLAVVVSKADYKFVQNALGIKLNSRPDGGAWADSGTAVSATLKAWFAEHESALYQAITRGFKSVRFFAASAVGPQDQPSGPFRPCGVVAPLLWLLSRRRELTSPRWHRFLWHAIEFAAVATVLGTFIWLAYLFAAYVLIPLIGV